MKRSVAAVLLCLVVLPLPAFAAPPPEDNLAASLQMPGLFDTVRVRRDVHDIPHIFAKNDRDVLFALGWIHAEDRFFQMDLLRRTFSGTLAELVGKDALASDVQLRTVGLRRAAEASLPTLSRSTGVWLESYARRVNAWLADIPQTFRPRPPRTRPRPATWPCWRAWMRPLDLLAGPRAFARRPSKAPRTRTITVGASSTASSTIRLGGGVQHPAVRRTSASGAGPAGSGPLQRLRRGGCLHGYSGHNVRADSVNEFMFGGGPARRFIGEMTPQGPVALLILPFLILSTAAAGCRYETYNFGNGDLKTLHEKTFPISPGKELKLDVSIGNVIISGWDKDEVYIKVLGNKKAEDKMEFEFNADENLVEVIAKKKGSVFNWFGVNGVALRFEVKVPNRFNNKAHTSGGDIKISDVAGTNTFKTSGGDVGVKKN